jgi:hypothetical protein
VPAGTNVAAVDPFDLPDWLGLGEVTWSARSSLRGAHLVRGELGDGSAALVCDLLAADRAFPERVLDEKWRRAAHQAWTFEQVLLVEYDGRLTLAVPGTAFTADLVLQALARLAKAVGVEPSRFVVALQL